ncbi:DNA/RNA non-specific endonuclease [Phyllobacterium sp. 21LDTY02-6]|uniref:DNA/RNA non-specific endonuclease n=1 Tax=Phyllobacterium sp. 21LDTY02-6 TaxID=2944903 RepID=UPI002020C5A3|nr:DNA/RNA non-specific endonuclease [Phyllobacterium sp. 21LDTY02-6]MCO4319044.1 DNA/RNA non-specific endonuclease [Phyllobacterium sp. 21LDTY02-6]
MDDVSFMSPSGSNSGVGIDHTENSHLSGQCSYSAYLGEKFYEYVAVIEMIHILATDESARRQLFEELTKSGWYHGLASIGHSEIAQSQANQALAASILDFLGFGDRKVEAEKLMGQSIENSRESARHAGIAAEKLGEYFQGLYEEIVNRYRECGVAYAFATVATDGAFFLGELAIGAGVAGVSAKALKSLKFVFRRLPDRKIHVEVKNPNGGSFERNFSQVELEAKYGKPEDNHVGVLREDTNREVSAGAAGSGKKKLTRGRNENEITYDPETGRPIGAKGTLRQDFGGTPRGDNATAVGRLGNEGDHGGHLVAHRFMGDTPDYGIAPQAGNLNTGAWKTMENEWADWIKKGYEVDYQIDVYPPGSTRPDSFDVTYQVRDPKTNRTIYEDSPEFKNKSGQHFDRVSFRDME